MALVVLSSKSGFNSKGERVDLYEVRDTQTGKDSIVERVVDGSTFRQVQGEQLTPLATDRSVLSGAFNPANINLGDLHGASYRPGGMYVPTQLGSFAFAGAQGDLTISPLVIARAAVIDRLYCETTVAAAAGGRVRLLVYGDDGLGMPGALLYDSGQLDTTVAAGLIAHVVPVRVVAGPKLWVGGVPQGGASATFRYSGNNSMPGIPWLAEAVGMMSGNLTGYLKQGVAGAPPAAWDATWLAWSNALRVGVRVA